MSQKLIPNSELYDSESYGRLNQQIEQALFRLKDTGVPSKNFKDWRHAGFWYDENPNDEKRSWVRLNLEEYIWVKMIQQMRQLGFATDLILKVKQQLITAFDIESAMESYQEQLLERLKHTELPPDEKKALINSIQSGQFKQDLQESPEAKKIANSQSVLKNLILAALSKRQNVAVLVYPEGWITPWLDEMFQFDPRTPELFQRTHLYLSITEHLMQFLIDPDKEAFISPLQLLNSEEHQVLLSIRDKSLKELKILFQKEAKSKKVSKMLITTKDGEISTDDEKAIADLLFNKRYSRIETKKKNGSVFYFESEIRKQL